MRKCAEDSFLLNLVIFKICSLNVLSYFKKLGRYGLKQLKTVSWTKFKSPKGWFSLRILTRMLDITNHLRAANIVRIIMNCRSHEFHVHDASSRKTRPRHSPWPALMARRPLNQVVKWKVRRINSRPEDPPTTPEQKDSIWVEMLVAAVKFLTSYSKDSWAYD